MRVTRPGTGWSPSVMPAKAGIQVRHSAHGAEAPVDRASVRDVGAVREPPERHAAPNVRSHPCPRHANEGWHPGARKRTRGGGPRPPCPRSDVGAVREPPEAPRHPQRTLASPSVMPAKAGIQVRHSAHGREEAMVRTMRRPTPRRRAVIDTYAHIPSVVPVKTGTSHPCPLSRHASEGWHPGARQRTR